MILILVLILVLLLILVLILILKDTSRGECKRRDADDFNTEAKIMRKLFVKGLNLETKGGTVGKVAIVIVMVIVIVILG